MGPGRQQQATSASSPLRWASRQLRLTLIQPVSRAAYVAARGRRRQKLFPLVLDLFNPSPPSGWLNQERSSIFERGFRTGFLALALVHHLAFTGNQPLENLAAFFNGLCRGWSSSLFPRTTPSHSCSAVPTRKSPSVRPSALRRELWQAFHPHHLQPVSQSGRVLSIHARAAPMHDALVLQINHTLSRHPVLVLQVLVL